MSKYETLTTYLKNREGFEWETSFSELSEILGFQLPDSAYSYDAWWSNSKKGHTQGISWLNAGWEIGWVDRDSETVQFRKNITELTKNLKPSNQRRAIEPLTIEEAKKGLAIHFGISAKSIEIVIRG